jgi:hypothetical protein
MLALFHDMLPYAGRIEASRWADPRLKGPNKTFLGIKIFKSLLVIWF